MEGINPVLGKATQMLDRKGEDPQSKGPSKELLAHMEESHRSGKRVRSISSRLQVSSNISLRFCRPRGQCIQYYLISIHGAPRG